MKVSFSFKDFFSTNGNAILLRKLTEMKGYKQLRNEITNEKMEKEKKVVSKFRNFERSVRSFVESKNERVKNEAWKQSLQNLTVDNSFDYGKTAITSVWDFAGQQEYYPTHQLFLSKNCIVLLVCDISKGLNPEISQETVLYERNPNRKQEQILSDVNGNMYNISLSNTKFTLIQDITYVIPYMMARGLQQ